MFKVIALALQLKKNPKLSLSLFFIFTAIATILEIFSIGVIFPLIQTMISGNENFVFKFNEIEYFEIKIQSIFFIFIFIYFKEYLFDILLLVDCKIYLDDIF